MKNLKILYGFVMVIMSSVFICSCDKENKDEKNFITINQTVESRSLCPSYLDVVGCTPNQGGTNVGGTLIYEGCSIPFQVLMHRCSWGVYFEPPVIDWNAVFSGIWLPGAPNTPCTQLANKLMGLSFQGKVGEMNNLLLDIKKQVSLFGQRRAILFNSQISVNFYPCDGNNPPTTYSAVTQETNCTMFCKKIVVGTGIFISEISCGSGCCTRKTPFCVTGPGEIQYGTPSYENSIPCVGGGIFNPTSCPEGSTTLEVCNTACSKI